MKHRVGFNRLGRTPSHRKAMTRNMLTSLFRHERIRTTRAKAMAVRRSAEKMITRARTDSVHNRRMIGRDIKDKAILAKIFTDIGPRFVNRPGGYTRVLKLGPRKSDAAEMVILELVKDEVEAKPAARRGSRRRKSEDEAPTEASPKKSRSRKGDQAPAAEVAAAKAPVETEAPAAAGETVGEETIAEDSAVEEAVDEGEAAADDEKSDS